MTQQTIKILVVDDHPVVRNGVREMLSSETDFVVVGEAASGDEALEQALLLEPDVVLMDLRMAGGDGVSATGSIVNSLPETHVLILTTYDADSDILPAIEAGATGYLLKDAPQDELHRAIRSAARGESVLSSSVAAKLMDRSRTGGSDQLTLREVEVLQLAARGAANAAIAEDLHLSQATIKYHLSQIYEKLGVPDRASAVAIALDRGMIRLSG